MAARLIIDDERERREAVVGLCSLETAAHSEIPEYFW
jgi:hypothetical protein